MAMWSWKQRGPFYRRAQAPQSFWSNNKDPEQKPRINLNPSESIHQNPGFETSFDSRFRFRDLLGSAILAENLPAAKATSLASGQRLDSSQGASTCLFSLFYRGRWGYSGLVEWYRFNSEHFEGCEGMSAATVESMPCNRLTSLR